MTSELKWLGVGIVLGVIGMALLGRHEYAALRAYTDSLAVASAAADSQSHAFSDSLKGVVAELSARKQKIVTKVVVNTVRIDSALAAAETVADTAAQVPALRLANRNLFQALAVADSIARAEKAGHDSALVVIETLNQSVQSMAERIRTLHKMPTLTKIGLGVGGVVVIAELVRIWTR